MEFLYQIVSIVIIDLVLSGDNAVVIGMAAHRLDPVQRRKAMLYGGGAAILLRLFLTTIAAFLLTLEGIQLGGGLLLLWIGFKLLRQEEESQEGIKVAANMREAVVTILVADFVMSLDNVLGVAGASHGSPQLLIFGLILSMGILMFMGNLVANLINKMWWLSYIGAGVIAWTGGRMIFEDKLIRNRVEWVNGVAAYVAAAMITALTLALAHWYHRIRNGVRRA
jgi:YjbE family integral membrane protein